MDRMSRHVVESNNLHKIEMRMLNASKPQFQMYHTIPCYVVRMVLLALYQTVCRKDLSGCMKFLFSAHLQFRIRCIVGSALNVVQLLNSAQFLDFLESCLSVDYFVLV